MRNKHSQCNRPILVTAVILLSAWFTGCGSDNGTNPTRFGRVEGTVTRPSVLAVADGPVEGATVRLHGGDFDSTAATDADGFYAFDPVPARRMTLSAALGSCLQTADAAINVPANDTAIADLVLAVLSDSDTISVGRAGAIRMEIDQATHRAILLFDGSGTESAPGIVVLELSTGQFVSAEFPDLLNVFDLEIINSDKVVFNYKSADGYGLRFYDPSDMASIGSDAAYPSGTTNHEGRLALDAAHEHVFVTHAIRQGINVLGKVYAVSVAQQQLVDADNDIFDGEFAFDADLVGNALAWGFNVAFDDATSEILIGNRTSTFVTAIDWNMWGAFDRDAQLTVPTPGVRIIDMEPPWPYNVDQGFGVEYWDFAGGAGIAAKPLSADARILLYESGEDASSGFLQETDVFPSSVPYTLKVVPERQSWFSIFNDPNPGIGKVKLAIEERATATLQRIGRYETRFMEDPAPRAFAIDADEGVLYVAYSTQTFIEVFCLH